MPEPILKIENLSKTFRSHWLYRPIKAVENLSLEVYPGEAFGFLGPNGAGKTTTIKCIVGLIHKTNGRVLFQGKELSAFNKTDKLSYLPEQPYFYDHLSVYETLEFLSTLYGLKGRDLKNKIERVLTRVGIIEKTNESVRSLSKGMQQRLALAQAIINEPILLILDEPFSGLDPIGRRDIRNIILELKHAGTTIIMSSHILSDVESICDRASIMTKGVLKEIVDLKELANRYSENFVITLEGLEETTDKFLNFSKKSSDVKKSHSSRGNCFTFLVNSQSTASSILKDALESNISVVEFKKEIPRLEDVFIKVAK